MKWEVLLAFCSVMVGSQANVEVMKDVTLGFGEALQNCREEVRTKSLFVGAVFAAFFQFSTTSV